MSGYSKGPKALDMFDRELGREWGDSISERQLLEIGKLIAHTDYAVCHYLDPWHPKFFGQRVALVRAVRRELARRSAYDDRLLRELERLRYDHEKSGPPAAEAVLAGLEELRRLVLDLDDDALDGFMREIAYGPRDNVADWGDDFLADWGYVVRADADEATIEELGFISARIGETRELIARAGAHAVIDLAERIGEHADSPNVARAAVVVATTWPLGDR